MKRLVKIKRRGQTGYTLIELMMVVTIIAILGSLVTPKFDVVLQKAYQSKAKANLGHLRTAIALYYSQNEGKWPLEGFPQGNSHFAAGVSLTSVLVPNFMPEIPTPKLLDRVGSFNEIAGSYDDSAASLMSMNPPNDVFIIWGSPDYTPLLSSPYAYDNQTGVIYYPNGNYDTTGTDYFYDW